jgi:hypothetical protein
MQITIDSLVLALLVALSPEPDQNAANERMIDGAFTEPRSARHGPLGPLPDPSACSYFVDTEARRKCLIRTSRGARSGADEPLPPESVIWVSPVEPRMPFSFGPNPIR